MAPSGGLTATTCKWEFGEPGFEAREAEQALKNKQAIMAFFIIIDLPPSIVFRKHHQLNN